MNASREAAVKARQKSHECVFRSSNKSVSHLAGRLYKSQTGLLNSQVTDSMAIDVLSVPSGAIALGWMSLIVLTEVR